MFFLYRFVILFTLIISPIIILIRLVKKKEHPDRFLDKFYCSKLAKTNGQEDFAESVMCCIAVRYKSHKMSQKIVKKINHFILNRIKFFDDLNLNVHPIK